MFEKEAEEYVKHWIVDEDDNALMQEAYKDGAEFGYNKANEELMLKLKDEGIVKPLKDSIFRNERLSSQEQQELCAWIECAMDFGENLDECAKELEELHKANEWHYVKDGDLPKDDKQYLVLFFYNYKGKKEMSFGVRDNLHSDFEIHRCYTEQIIAWKEIVLPKESE